jgi:hypothetical protein
LVKVDGRCFFAFSKVTTTSVTELTARRVNLSTFWADNFQPVSTSIAESGVFGVLMLAFWAFHVDALQTSRERSI